MQQRKTNTFLKRYRLWVISLIIVLPLLTICVVQYRSLRTLEQTLPLYRRDSLTKFLMAVSREVQKTYADNINRVLGVPAQAITLRQNGIIQDNADQTRVQQAVEPVAAHFKQQEFKGAKRYFIVVATEHNGVKNVAVLFYNSARQAMELDPQAPELRSINAAATPYVIYIRSQMPLKSSIPSRIYQFGSSRSLEYPVTLKPILDEEQRMVAIAGLTFNQEWFEREIVPQAVTNNLPKFFPAEYQDAIVTLRLEDKDNQLVYTNQSVENPKAEVSAGMNVSSQMYMLGIRMRDLSIEQWARRSFVINLTLTLTVTLVLIGGLLLGLRAASREMKLSQMKTDFVANVSHELRTPLSSILVLAELMKLGRVKDFGEVREFGQYIDSQGQRLMQLINNILDFSRIESGQKAFQFERADVREVIEEAIEACAGQVKQSGQSIRFEPAIEPLPLLMIDPNAMTLALINLLDNAIKYSSEAGEILVRLSRDGETVKISVTDQGIGIAREEQERIFEKFYRVSTGLVHDVKGSGLGLAIVKHIVEAHRGQLKVESELGRGSTFTIYLPLTKPDAALSNQADPKAVVANDECEG